MTTHRKDWTILGYLAGDNDLESAALEDINEMEVVGSTDDFDVIVQIDRSRQHARGDGDWKSTRRYRITQGVDRRAITSELLADLGPTNTGDPRVLCDFIRTGVRDYPARRTMLTLWNHGSGFYVPPEMCIGEDAPKRREISRARAKLKRSFFHTSRAEILAQPARLRGILYDDGSSDCLDNQELARVVAYAAQQLGGKLDVLGMDACLMTMLEVAYQVKDHVEVLVGSEETEPSAGWAYDRILADLAAHPAMSAATLGETIVKRYIESYDTSGPDAPDLTQSVLDLNKLEDLTEAVDALARVLIDRSTSMEEKGALMFAWRKSTRFYDNLYVDIHDLARNLAGFTSHAAIKSACNGVMAAIEGRGAQTPIIAERHFGRRMSRVKGLSIYMPPTWTPSAYYHDLAFAKRTRWGEFLQQYLE